MRKSAQRGRSARTPNEDAVRHLRRRRPRQRNTPPRHADAANPRGKRKGPALLQALKEWWPRTESNRRHGDFQSPALPTELLGHCATRQDRCEDAHHSEVIGIGQAQCCRIFLPTAAACADCVRSEGARCWTRPRHPAGARQGRLGDGRRPDRRGHRPDARPAAVIPPYLNVRRDVWVSLDDLVGCCAKGDRRSSNGGGRHNRTG